MPNSSSPAKTTSCENIGRHTHPLRQQTQSLWVLAISDPVPFGGGAVAVSSGGMAVSVFSLYLGIVWTVGRFPQTRLPRQLETSDMKKCPVAIFCASS